MHILITGGTGFIGRHLCHHFINKGCKVTVLSRYSSHPPYLPPTVHITNNLIAPQTPYDVIINLAGEPLNKKRWSAKVKQDIYNSRINTTQNLINYIHQTEHKPKILINGSAIGYYDDSLDYTFSEEDVPLPPFTFPQKLCHDWENIAMKAQVLGVRVCIIRLGIVLGKNGGILKEILPSFKLGLGAQLGSGNQWMSWIHIKDVIGAVDYLIHHPELTGPFNLTAPTPATNSIFTKTLAQTLHRPCFLKLPPWFIKMLFGEMGSFLLLKGQRVMPKHLLDVGYHFHFKDLDAALINIIK